MQDHDDVKKGDIIQVDVERILIHQPFDRD